MNSWILMDTILSLLHLELLMIEQNSKWYYCGILYIIISAVKRLIAIKHIQNKQFGLYNICVYTVYIYEVYI